jgi:hypothetical protein
MSSPVPEKKKPYSSLYKIYRRVRFIRYKNSLLKKSKLELKRKEKQEKKEHLRQIKQFKISEKKRLIIKSKAEREETKNKKREIREEFRLGNKQAKLEWEKLSVEGKKHARKVRLDEKRAKTRLFRSNLRYQINNFFLSVRSINIRTFRGKLEAFRNNAPKRRLLYLISINSTVFFLLAYFCLFLISQVVTVITASFFHYPTIAYYYEIFFNINPEAWYPDSVKTIFSSGPLVSFVIGISFLTIYSNLHDLTGPYKLFFLWGFLHGVNMLFGALLVGTLFETGIGHVISWMYVTDTGKVLYSIISVFLLVIAGLISTRQFLISGNTYYNEINKTNRTNFIISQILVPYFVGNTFLILLRLPRFIFYDTFIGIALIICIVPVLMTFRSYNELYFEDEEKKPGIAMKALAVLTAVILIFRGVLEIGIHFGG